MRNVRSDIPERVENRKFTTAMDLLRRIPEVLDPDNFSLKEIREHINAATRLAQDEEGQALSVRYGASHLKTLEKRGLIEKIQGTRYRVIVDLEVLEHNDENE